jgi:hypothetical protein
MNMGVRGARSGMDRAQMPGIARRQALGEQKGLPEAKRHDKSSTQLPVPQQCSL